MFQASKSRHWFSDSVVYHIFLDRFTAPENSRWDQPKFLGGNLRGVISKLDYLSELGIDVLWLSPFYAGDAYHGYHVTDFFRVDTRFGDEDDLLELVDEVHARDLKIIVDFVPNHCSKLHPFFLHAQRKKESPYRHWFLFSEWPEKYYCFLDYDALPKLNLKNPEAADHIISAALKWLSFGFDGFRLDHVVGPDLLFWRQFRDEIKRRHPETLLIGEAWLEGVKWRHIASLGIRHKYWRFLFGVSPDQLYRDYVGVLDGVLDFQAQLFFKRFALSERTAKDEASLRSALTKHFSKFPSHFHLPVFLDNHDMNRFLFECGNDIEAFKASVAILFECRQAAILYYGTEVGLTQENSIHSREKYGDALARAPMPWGNMNDELLNFFKDQIRQRRDRKMLRTQKN